MPQGIVVNPRDFDKDTLVITLALVEKFTEQKADSPLYLPYYLITGNREEIIKQVNRDINSLFDSHEKSSGKFGE